MNNELLLIELTEDQIREAKAVNGERRRITHAVVCGELGQLFGTEIQCRKYFTAWSKIFPFLFNGGREVASHEFQNYESTTDLTMALIAAHNELKPKGAPVQFDQCLDPPKRRGSFLGRLLSMWKR